MNEYVFYLQNVKNKWCIIKAEIRQDYGLYYESKIIEECLYNMPVIQSVVSQDSKNKFESLESALNKLEEILISQSNQIKIQLNYLSTIK